MLRSGLRRTWRWMFASVQHIACRGVRTRKTRQSTCASRQPLWRQSTFTWLRRRTSQHRHLSRQTRTNERVARPKRLRHLFSCAKRDTVGSGLWIRWRRYERSARFSRCNSRDPARGWSVRLTTQSFHRRVHTRVRGRIAPAARGASFRGAFVHAAFFLAIVRSIRSATRSAFAKAGDTRASLTCQRMTVSRVFSQSGCPGCIGQRSCAPR